MINQEKKFRQLFEAFVQLKLPYRYDSAFVCQYFANKYGAVELNPLWFIEELMRDSYFHADFDTHVLAFGEGVGSVRHEDEDSRAVAVDQGRVIYIIFQSRDGMIDCDFSAVHGDLPDLYAEMTVFNGIDQTRVNLDFPDFRHYLQQLAQLDMV
jgi:hypothetical protein